MRRRGRGWCRWRGESGREAVGGWRLAAGEKRTANGQRLTAIPVSHAPRPTFFIALALIALKFLVVDNIETPFRHAAAPPLQHPFTLTVSGLQLAGYDLSDETIPSGETITVDLAWLTLASPGRNLQTSLTLRGADGLSWSVKEIWRPRLYEDASDTLFWQPGQWGWDSWEVTTLPGTPAGTYDLVLTVFDLDTLQPLTLAAADSSSLGPAVVLGQIQVTTPRRPVAVSPQYPAQLTLNGWQLLGYNLDRESARPGDHFLLTLFWEAQADRPTTTPVNLVDEAGGVVQSWEIPLVRDGYAAASGEQLRGQHWLRLAAALPSGTYQLQLGQTPLRPITLSAPNRILVEPAFTTPIAATFAETVTLLGYTQSPVSNLQFPLTLIWQTQTELLTSYHVFVHLVNGEGTIVAQADGEPAGWSRPTTGWMPGEYILDDHILTLPPDLPPGDYQLRFGLYDPATNQRLSTPTGDAVAIPLTLP